MTSINALRINRNLGIMVCDEQRHWNPERLKIYAADKIRLVVPPEITERYRLVAAYGNTGTSSIGDELRLTIYREIENFYHSQCEHEGHPPEKFMSIEDIASFVFKIITRTKIQHIDSELLYNFGFTTEDFFSGKFKNKDGKSIDIQDEKVIERAHELISGKSDPIKFHAVFNNAGIVAGYDPDNGFSSYLFSMRENFWEPVYGGFVAQGSGSDSANFVLGSLFSERPLLHQNAPMDQIDAIIRLLLAVDKAARNNLGVGGYFNILIFDGNAKNPLDILRQINDHRSKLASETVRAFEAGLLHDSDVREILDGILFHNKDCQWGETRMWEGTPDKLHLHRFLRGYSIFENV
ncbi:MAG: hypothetical protein A2161_21530 [Candidatus Schekmanbacteria bacterium RBG_13_48_7]|uniref:Uncharacterized protein n=1 Tax=Candidatus Schekmanbacteria bacterium RBG_13_48_7 TaxID=1817878 RepID=A0A1F7RR08_9BACT|nr:MAG: hypothetical protein A2161_21530 [Candidatus Schekmanbacteria bacterium RBG_13_48_7]